jgi:hypothetical protein
VTTPMLRRSKVAQMFDVHPETVRRWAAAGLLDERRVGPRSVRVTAASVEALIHDGAGDRPQEDNTRDSHDLVGAASRR